MSKAKRRAGKKKAAKKKAVRRKPAAHRPAARKPAAPTATPRPVVIPGAWPFPMGSKP